MTAWASERRRPLLVVTADDFGRDSVCTAAIVASLERGTITSTSIMANAACFAEACELARSRRLTDRIGVHIALDEGPPLSAQMRQFADANGNLCVRRTLKPLHGAFGVAVRAEIDAQVRRVIDAGITPTHLDSHRHIHTAWPIGRLLLQVAREFGIRYVRPARNVVQRSSLPATLYKSAFNRYVTWHARTADFFCDIEDIVVRGYAAPAGSMVECMIHLDGSPRGLEGQRLLDDERYRQALQHYQLVGHAGTR